MISLFQTVPICKKKEKEKLIAFKREQNCVYMF